MIISSFIPVWTIIWDWLIWAVTWAVFTLKRVRVSSDADHHTLDPVLPFSAQTINSIHLFVIVITWWYCPLILWYPPFIGLPSCTQLSVSTSTHWSNLLAYLSYLSITSSLSMSTAPWILTLIKYSHSSTCHSTVSTLTT